MSQDAQDAQGSVSTAHETPLPVCYSSLTPLAPHLHADLRFARTQGYAFACGLTAAPALAEEFMVAQATMPIVFTRNDQPQPAFLLGTSPEQNAFVDASNAWRAGAYVPSFLRRYPFMLVRQDAASSRLVLCADLTADGFSDADGAPLFENGERSTMLGQVLDFCQRFHRAQQATAALVAELTQRNLLQDAVLTVSENGQARRIDGFRTVSEDRLKALPDEVLADFARRGIVGLIAAHWASLQTFQGAGIGAEA